MKHRRRLVMLIGLMLMLALGIWLLLPRLTEPIDSYNQCTQAGYPVADTQPPVCTARGHAFVGPSRPAAPAPEAVASWAFEILVDGDSGGAYPQRQETITSQTDWQRYWRQVHTGLASLPPLLPVDFATSNVVALSEGRQPTSGFNLKVTGITSTATGTRVDFTESVPTITCKVAVQPTNRYFVVRTAKLPSPISFRLTLDHHHCP